MASIQTVQLTEETSYIIHVLLGTCRVAVGLKRAWERAWERAWDSGGVQGVGTFLGWCDTRVEERE